MYEFMNVTSTNTLPDVCSFPSQPSACILRSNQWEHIFSVNLQGYRRDQFIRSCSLISITGVLSPNHANRNYVTSGFGSLNYFV